MYHTWLNIVGSQALIFGSPHLGPRNFQYFDLFHILVYLLEFMLMRPWNNFKKDMIFHLYLCVGGGIPQSSVLAYPGTPFVISGGRSPHPSGHIQLLPHPTGPHSPSAPHMLSPTAGNPNISAGKVLSIQMWNFCLDQYSSFAFGKCVIFLQELWAHVEAILCPCLEV